MLLKIKTRFYYYILFLYENNIINIYKKKQRIKFNN